jgi:diguanylate cyclase (GGDEF)-like protein
VIPSRPSAVLHPEVHSSDKRSVNRGQGREELEVAFWLSHLRVGFGVFIGEAVAVVVYLLGSPHGAHRGVLTAIAVTSACIGLLSLFGIRTIASKPWRHGFSLSWSLGAGWLLAGCAHLDGGLESPMLYLVLFPVIYAALAFRPAAVAACGASALAELVAISAVDGPSALPRANLFMVAAVVGGMSALAVAASMYRTRLQHHEGLLADELEALADTDGLTGCLNHRAFHERLVAEVNRAVRYDRPVCLVLADIDEFKAVNDTYGHPVGDEVLAAVGRALRRGLRNTDVAGRLGGDEFGIILAETSLAEAEISARRIGPRLEPDVGPAVALSIGVAGLDRSDPTPARLIADADRALYHVKGTGRNGIAATSASGAPARFAR